MKQKAWYGAGGALVTDTDMPGITQKLDQDAAEYYGGVYFIAESMSERAAKKIATLLDLDYRGQVK